MRKKHIRWIAIAFCAYMLLLIKFILLKKPKVFLSSVKHWGIDNARQQGRQNLILVPFKTAWIYLSGERGLWSAVENLGGNILGFVPLGIMLPMLFTKLNGALKTILTVFLISLSFELTQFMIGVGYCDVDDLIQNTLGGAIGFWLYKKFLRHYYSTSTKAAHG